MPTGIPLSGSILVGTQKPTDARYGPYATVAAALQDLTPVYRHKGLTVGIETNGVITEYWFNDGIQDTDFVVKSLDPNSDIATTGIDTTTGSPVLTTADRVLYNAASETVATFDTNFDLRKPLEFGGTSASTNAATSRTNLGAAAANHGHDNFGAATSSANGTAGFVPAPAAGHNGRFLRGDASWADNPVPNLPTGSQLTYAEIFNSSTTASITTQLLGAGGLNTSGAGNWVPVVDTNPSIYEIADKSSDVTFNKGTGALTFAAKAATTVYQFVATIGCFKGESGSNGVDIGISIDGANPIVQHYTSIPTPGFTTTQREISVSGVFELSPGVQHTVRLMVRQSGGGNASSANSISMRTLNLNISSINALVEATVFGGVTSVNGQTPDQNGAVTVALPQPSSVNPPPSAVAAVIGTSTDYARADHAHPADLLDAVHIVGQPDSVADGVYFRHDTVLGYPAYKKVNPDGAIVLLEVEVGAGPERWGVLVPSTGETLYRSTNLSSFPWDAAGWTTVDALGAFESISQAKAGVAARKAVTIVTTGEVEQSGPIVSLHPVAESGDYNDLSNTPTEFAGANATDPGSAGLVPAPLAGDNTKFLRGDGTWAEGGGGLPGEDGREVEFQKSATHIQWRYVGDATWTNLVLLDDIKGADGQDGASVLSGPVDPTAQANIGKDGDFYINTTTKSIFGPRLQNGWGQGTSLTGPTGPAPAGTGLVSVTNGVLDTPQSALERGLVTKVDIQAGSNGYFERTADAASQSTGGGVVIHQIVLANDSRLTNARTPTSHTHRQHELKDNNGASLKWSFPLTMNLPFFLNDTFGGFTDIATICLTHEILTGGYLTSADENDRTVRLSLSVVQEYGGATGYRFYIATSSGNATGDYPSSSGLVTTHTPLPGVGGSNVGLVTTSSIPFATTAPFINIGVKGQRASGQTKIVQILLHVEKA